MKRKPPSTPPENGDEVRTPVRRSDLAGFAPEQLTTMATGARREIVRLVREIHEAQQQIGNLRGLLHSIARVTGNASLASQADRAAEIVAANGGPMRVSDLLNAMAAAGIVVGGKTRKHQLTNLLIALGRSRQFERRSPGVYALAARRASA